MSAFPKLDTPSFQVVLPVSKTQVTFRPYLSKEEKLLLMALETKEPKSILDTIRQIAINCVVLPNNFNVDVIPMVDLEYLFMHLRAKSKGEILEAQFNCKAILPDTEDIVCNNLLTLTTRIDNLTVSNMENFTSVIPITDKVGVTMRLPRYKDSASTNVSSSVIFSLVTG